MDANGAQDPTRRFSERVAYYLRSRPRYPAELLGLFESTLRLTPPCTIADIGSGTGILSRMLLEWGATVLGVEPNFGMRQAAEQELAAWQTFRSVAARAEATTLPTHSVDAVTVAQAFHWCEPEASRDEFRRILKPHGWVVLLWNQRRADNTPFLRAYEQFLQDWGTDYREVSARHRDPKAIESLFGQDAWRKRTFFNEQRFDFGGLTDRVLSSSYMPARGHPRHGPMLDALRALFDAYQEHDSVSFEYDTDVYFGRVGDV